MNEQQPLGDVNLQELFAAINGRFVAGENIGDLFGVSSKPEEVSGDRQVLLEAQGVKFLEQAFRNVSLPRLVELDIRVAGKLFQENYEKWAKSKLRSPFVRPEDRELAEFSTLQDLAAAAENEVERITRQSGTVLPDSDEASRLKADAYRWEIISTIVRAASEIKE